MRNAADPGVRGTFGVNGGKSFRAACQRCSTYSPERATEASVLVGRALPDEKQERRHVVQAKAERKASANQ